MCDGRTAAECVCMMCVHALVEGDILLLWLLYELYAYLPHLLRRLPSLSQAEVLRDTLLRRPLGGRFA